jgi:hypothetical protein
MEIKQLTKSLHSLRSQNTSSLEEMKESILNITEKLSMNAIEQRMVSRINDVIKALTKTMADRNDTKKNFRILDKQVKNLFDILMHLNQGGGSLQIP